MTEARTSGLNEQDSRPEQEATPFADLAYEGLMRVVEAGGITRDDALAEHRAMFPDHQE